MAAIRSRIAEARVRSFLHQHRLHVSAASSISRVPNKSLGNPGIDLFQKSATDACVVVASSLRTINGPEPDVMFLLSDGEIPLNTRNIVQQANRGTAIHTIAFGSNAGGHILKQIATDTGGTQRFIGDGF